MGEYRNFSRGGAEFDASEAPKKKLVLFFLINGTTSLISLPLRKKRRKNAASPRRMGKGNLKLITRGRNSQNEVMKENESANNILDQFNQIN